MLTSPVAQVFAEQWPQILATLRRDLGDLDLAEECVQDAFVEAAARWGPGSTPARPGAWLVTTARRKAVDRLRRDRRFTDRLPALAELASGGAPQPAGELVDDQLALIFGCCHPALDAEARVALTLREVCGLSTDQIAASFLVPTATMAKRLVRAKAKIRAAGVPFAVPARADLPGRCAEVLRIVYVIFTAGHTSNRGPALVRGDLCDEARWLAALLADLLTDGGVRDQERTVSLAETLGLAALMLFTDARRPARLDGAGRLVLLQDQDRTRWDPALIGRGQATLARAMGLGHVSAYQLEAAISGVHATAPDWASTDWATILALYDHLLRISPTDVVRLNRAVAVSMVDGPAEALIAVDDLVATAALADYRYLHATRADLLRRLGRFEAAAQAYQRAIDAGGNEAEAHFLQERLAHCRRQAPHDPDPP